MQPASPRFLKENQGLRIPVLLPVSGHESRHESHHPSRRQRTLPAAPTPLGVSRQHCQGVATRVKPCACSRTTASFWPGPPSAPARKFACAPGASTKTNASTPTSSPAACNKPWPAPPPGHRQQWHPPDSRRSRRPARPDRRPIRRHPQRPVPQRRHRALEDAIADALVDATGCAYVYERSDSGVRPRRPGAGDRLVAPSPIRLKGTPTATAAPPRSPSPKTAGS